MNPSDVSAELLLQVRQDRDAVAGVVVNVSRVRNFPEKPDSGG